MRSRDEVVLKREERDKGFGGRERRGVGIIRRPTFRECST